MISVSVISFVPHISMCSFVSSFVSVIPVGDCRSATVMVSWGGNHLFGFIYGLFSCENIAQLALFSCFTLLHLLAIASPELPMRIP